MLGEVKNLKGQIIAKATVTGTLTVKRHSQLIKSKPIEYFCNLALLIFLEILAIFVFPLAMALIVDFIACIAWVRWGDLLVNKVDKRIKRFKKKLSRD